MPFPHLVRRFALPVAILLVALGMRALWLTADPPTSHPVGVVWHDEGAWVHNARNQALLGVWRTDAWNPLFIAPVFTALEYVSFETFGVGTWQARMVPLLSGLTAIIALMAGLTAVGGRRAALLGGALLSTNYTFVMWNRAALMESTMTAFIVVSWAAYALATNTTSRRHSTAWAVLAGAAAVAAFFTKAAAAFFIAALVLESATGWWLSRRSAGLKPGGSEDSEGSPPHIPPSLHFPIFWGLSAAGAVALVVLVVPYWAEFQFYNWEMTVTRKPSYGLEDFKVRASWLPIVHGTFTRMWLVLVLAAGGVLAVVSRWRTANPAQRLAVLWLAIGLAELVVHSSGDERRYVMFVPVIIAMAALPMGKWEIGGMGRWAIVSATGAALAYLAAGSLLRLVWLDQVMAQDYKTVVRVSAAIAALAGAAVWLLRTRLVTWLDRRRLPAWGLGAVVLITIGTDATLYAGWAQSRTFFNVEASRMLADLLPPGTLVHGKLANGLSLENRIEPVFVGRGFGNYDDRLERDDARYILSYTQPEPGYEGDVILDVLQHYPQRRVMIEFDVQETPGPDRAALIEKFPDGPDTRARDK